MVARVCRLRWWTFTISVVCFAGFTFTFTFTDEVLAELGAPFVNPVAGISMSS